MRDHAHDPVAASGPSPASADGPQMSTGDARLAWCLAAALCLVLAGVVAPAGGR